MIVSSICWEVLPYRVRPGKPHLRLWIGEYPPVGDC